MRIFICTSILILLDICFSYGQDQLLHFSYACKSNNSPFKKVNVIDDRSGIQTLGFVQVGGFNRIAHVKYEGDFSDSLAKFFKCTDTSSNADKELTIVLYEFYLSEKTEGMSETGRFKLSMRLFSGLNEGNFKEILSIDSIYSFNALDVTKRLLRSVSEHLCEIAKSASDERFYRSEQQTLYSLGDLQHLDSLEKLNIPVYTADKVNPGIYTDFKHFKLDMPDSSIVIVDTSNSKNIKVYKWNTKHSKKIRIDNNDVYAVSDGNTLYKATTIGFYEMKKTGFDFYFVGQTSFSNSNNVAMWGTYFGIIGAVIASGAERNTQIFRFKISYLKGNSIPISISKGN